MRDPSKIERDSGLWLEDREIEREREIYASRLKTKDQGAFARRGGGVSERSSLAVQKKRSTLLSLLLTMLPVSPTPPESPMKCGGPIGRGFDPPPWSGEEERVREVQEMGCTTGSSGENLVPLGPTSPTSQGAEALTRRFYPGESRCFPARKSGVQVFPPARLAGQHCLLVGDGMCRVDIINEGKLLASLLFCTDRRCAASAHARGGGG